MRVLGLDPGLRRTGWGVVDAEGSRLTHVAHGVITSESKDELADRLVQLHRGVDAVLGSYQPDEAAMKKINMVNML